MKRLLIIMTVLLCLLTPVGCAPQIQQYQTEFIDTFDTVVTVIGYSDSEEEFAEAAEVVHDTFAELHRLFDIYFEYEGVTNIKTINDNAGVTPVEVDVRIIDLLKSAVAWHDRTGGAVNVAMGPVLKVWHDYREAGLADPDNAALPPMDELMQASAFTDLSSIVIDEEKSTVYIEAGMRIDVGAIAKGYAAQAAAEALKQRGFDSVLISAGGNVRAVGVPADERTKWGVGIKDPQSSLGHSTSEENLLDAAYVADKSVVSSGGYERFYTVDGAVYHHLIDPDTLMPADHYTGVTVVTDDSTAADVLSTAIFILPPTEATALIESMDDTEALWVTEEGAVTMSSGMAAYLRDRGGARNTE